MPEKIFNMDSDFTPLHVYDMIYLATPYTKYPFGIYEAARDAALISGRLIRRGLDIFSPIVHAHYISMATGIDPIDHTFWMKVDYAFMKKCDALMICHMSGWEESRGVGLEIDEFAKAKKPSFHLNPGFIR